MISNFSHFCENNNQFKISDHYPKLKWDDRDFSKSQKWFHIHDERVISLFKSLPFETLAALAATPHRQLVWMTHDLLYEKFVQKVIKCPKYAVNKKAVVDYKAVILYCATRSYVRKALSDLSLKNIRNYFIKKSQFKKGLSKMEISVDRTTGSIMQLGNGCENLSRIVFYSEATWAYTLCVNHLHIDSQIKKVMASEDRIFNEILWKEGKLKTMRFHNQLFWQRHPYLRIFSCAACVLIFINTLLYLAYPINNK